ncbi:hypothetical protein [Actinomadura geliboluensis]|uniref:hypothetical protein n=1 Tax=Actinomadura geliboluensis TaxID=882440 RepID=UPI00371622BD
MEVVAPMLGVGLLVSSSGIAPPPRDPLPPNANSYSYNFGAQDGSRPAGGGRTSAAAPEGNHAGVPQEPGPRDCQALSEYVQVVCPEAGEGGKASKVSPAELALTKWARMPIPAPVVRTAPPRRRGGLVGLPEWFWVTNWHSLSGRVSARNVWVEVTARPQSMTIAPGPGEPVVRCSGPGTAYDKTRSAALQRTDCSYTFARSSLHEPGQAYRVRVTVLWGGTWRGSDGSGGALPPLSRSTTFLLRVAEAQALYG